MRTTSVALALSLIATAVSASGPAVILPIGLQPRSLPAKPAHVSHPRPGLKSARASSSSGAPARRASTRHHRALDLNLLLGQLRTVQSTLNDCQQRIHGSRDELQENPSVGKSRKYKHEISNQLADFRRASGGATPIITDLTSAFSDFGRENGKANYDKTQALQVLLKDFVDSNKYMLADINYIVYTIPTLGPVLGPIVYDVKCLLDTLLDGTENLIDGLLNGNSNELTRLLASLNLSLGNGGLLGGTNLLSAAGGGDLLKGAALPLA